MNDDTLNLSISPICHTDDGKKYAYVSFSDTGDKSRFAEGKIPSCKIEKYEGFSEDEVKMLELYLKNNLAMLKKTAAGLNVFDAFRKG